MSSVIEKWRGKFAATRDSEEGAETIEIIVFLAIFVLGMVGVWFLIRNAAADKGQDIENCLNVSNTDAATAEIEC